MAAEALMHTALPQLSSSGVVYVNPDNDWWYAAWYDHVGRLIRRRLRPVDELGGYVGRHKDRPPAKALDLAWEVVQYYIESHHSHLAEKHRATEQEIEDRCWSVPFPRAVVKAEIERICNRISRYDLINEDTKNGQLGLSIFEERLMKVSGARKRINGYEIIQMGISSREINRILEDEERITVARSIVDMICVEFDMLFDDFIIDSRNWSDKEGRWRSRFGTEDSWPFGYVVDQRIVDEDII